MNHTLKIWPGPFEAVLSGKKRYEVRSIIDRQFNIDDEILLSEWEPISEMYTGRNFLGQITYITQAGSWGLPSDICILGFNEVI